MSRVIAVYCGAFFMGHRVAIHVLVRYARGLVMFSIVIYSRLFRPTGILTLTSLLAYVIWLKLVTFGWASMLNEFYFSWCIQYYSKICSIWCNTASLAI